jgi:phospholipase/carboxylesterase
LLLQLIEELLKQGVASQDIFFFGFSQGCLMATDVGLRCQHVLGGVCGISGYVGFFDEYPDAFSPVARDQKFLFSHGMRDPVVPYAPAKDQFLKLKGHGIQMLFNSYDKDHTVLPEELRDIATWFRERVKSST